MQSGLVIDPWVIQKQPDKAFNDLVLKTRCAPTAVLPKKYQVNCLKNLATEELIIGDILNLALTDLLGYDSGFSAAIVVEDPADPNPILIRNPLQQLKDGKIRTGMPLTLSVTSEEMLPFFFVAETCRFKSNAELVPFDMHPENPSEVGRKIKTHYAGNELGWTTASTSTLIEYLSDVTMNFPLRHFVDKVVDVINAPIYILQFSYISPIGKYNNGVDKVGHGDDLFYTWKFNSGTFKIIGNVQYTEDALEKMSQFNIMITNFAKTQNPIPSDDPKLNFLWTPVTPDSSVFYLDFNKEVTLKLKIKNENYQFWSELYSTYGRGVVSL